jgi:hypothetical protein
MTTSTTAGRRAPGRALKSPLAVPGVSAAPAAGNSRGPAPAPGRAALSDREATLAEFQGYLRTVNNRDGRPFEEKTIAVYCTPVKSLNRYFREYYLEHGRGGTHTQQRNLIQLFNYLERERGSASPYADGLNRYAAVKGRPKTLDSGFIEELLQVMLRCSEITSGMAYTTANVLFAAANANSVASDSSATFPYSASLPDVSRSPLATGAGPSTATRIRPLRAASRSIARVPVPSPASGPRAGAAAWKATDAAAQARPAAVVQARRCGSTACRSLTLVRIIPGMGTRRAYSGGSSTAAGRSQSACTSRTIPSGSPIRRVSSTAAALQASRTANSLNWPGCTRVRAAAAAIAAQ